MRQGPFTLSGVDSEQFIYKILLEEILENGEEVSPRGLKTKTLRNAVIVHDDPGDVLLAGLGRKLSSGLLALEPLQLVGGFSDPDLTVAVVPRYSQFLDGSIFWGAYGPRLAGKMELVAERLRRDVNTRQAHVSFWDDRLDLAHEGKHDYPCTISAHFEIDAEMRLHGTTVMRSNDAWLGFPYDVVQHTCLLKTLATYLGVPVGTYTHVVHNLHLYETDWEAARALVDVLHRYSERPRLDGGIGTGQEKTWAEIRQRAMNLTWSPNTVQPATPEEEWYHAAMIKVHEKVEAK